MITTISFDGDATLWDFESVMRHALGIVLRELRRRIPGPPTDGLTIEHMIDIRETVSAELDPQTVSLEEIRHQAFRRTLEVIGCPDDTLAREINALYVKHRFEDLELYTDVIATFDALAPRFRLGLLSNGNGYPERVGLAGRFQFVVFSQEVGVAKPAAKIFAVACEQAGCRADQLMHVGDSLESDVAGANGVGAVSVWLNRDGVINDTGIRPDYEIRSLSGLERILSA
jgi:putative hydrolase of the HAD superfamily